MYLTACQISAIGQLLLQKGEWNGQQLIPAWWIEEMGKKRVKIKGDEKKALTHYAYHIKAGDEIFAAEGAFGQYLICFRNLPVTIGITAGARDYIAADICLKYIKKALDTPCGIKEMAESERLLEQKVHSLSLKEPDGNFRNARMDAEKLFDREIVFEDNPRKIESVTLKKVGYQLSIKATIDGQQKLLHAGYKLWKKNDLYPGDFTKRYHSVAYSMDAEALYISVGLICKVPHTGKNTVCG